MNSEKSTYVYFLKIISIPVIFLALLGLLIFKIYRQDYIQQQESARISEVISNTIELQSSKGLLTPRTIFINIDTAGKGKIILKFNDDLKKALLAKYLKNDSKKLSKLNLQPYFPYLDTISGGNFQIDQEKLSEIKNHIEFLSSQVDKAVDSVKQEVGNDIDRLNTWLSIWIGILSFIGIFIPIFINYELRKDTEQAKLDSKKAIIDSDTAFKKAEKAKYSSDANDLLLKLFHSISILKELEVTSLRIVSDRMAFLITILENFHEELSSCNDHIDHKITIDSIRQLGIRLHLISRAKINNMPDTKALNDFALLIDTTLKSGLTKESFQNIIKKLKILIDHLKASK